jgi:hypothetical protein
MEGTTGCVTENMGPLDVSRIFVSSGVPGRALGTRGWPGLFGRMKGLIRMKSRSRGRGWAIFVHPDEKRCPGGLVGETAGDALKLGLSTLVTGEGTD